MINKRLKAISLFSGAMGLDLGIEKAGIEIKLCVELNKQAVATIRNNTDIPVIDRDITTIPTTELLEVSGLKLGDVDLVVDRLGEVKSFLEIKSGFNDMDAGQVKHYADEIKLVEEAGNKGYIGITYGKKDDNTVTAGLLKTYVPNWEDKTLVGKELWDFISENENYHTILIESIDSVANTTLQNVSIVQKIEDKIAELIEVFHTNYTSLSEYYESLW